MHPFLYELANKYAGKATIMYVDVGQSPKLVLVQKIWLFYKTREKHHN